MHLFDICFADASWRSSTNMVFVSSTMSNRKNFFFKLVIIYMLYCYRCLMSLRNRIRTALRGMLTMRICYAIREMAHSTSRHKTFLHINKRCRYSFIEHICMYLLTGLCCRLFGQTCLLLAYVCDVGRRSATIESTLSIYGTSNVIVSRVVDAMHFFVSREAYDMACLGVTETDWEILAIDALQALKLDIARKAFQRVRNLRFLELINDIEVYYSSRFINDHVM